MGKLIPWTLVAASSSPDEVEVKHYAEKLPPLLCALCFLTSGSARTIFVPTGGETLPAPEPDEPLSLSGQDPLVSPPRRPLRLSAMRAIRFC